jgi:hypothetical protein
MINPARGQKLREAFDQIAWDETSQPNGCG